MSTGLKRTFYPVKLFFPVIALMVVLALLYGSFFRSTNEAEANIALFNPTNCLGGWKNVDKIAGPPEVRADNDVKYNDENSASTLNSNAQVFCGGFSGEIPDTAKHQKITLNFSWYIGDIDDQEESVEINFEPQLEVIEESPAPVLEESVEVPSDVPAELPTATEEPPAETILEPVIEEAVSEPMVLNFFKNFFTIVYAQEPSSEPSLIEAKPTMPVEAEVVAPPEPVMEELGSEAASVIEEVVSTPRLEETIEPVESTTGIDPADGAYFEVLYTLNGQDWHTLGFVYRIANDVQIDIPVDLFATVEDLNKVQIALHTVERFDSVPKIYLDSLWLEVTYDDLNGEIVIPPGSRPGDVIFSETSYQDEKVVAVLRNVELMTLSNVLSAATATGTASSTLPETTVSTSTEVSIATSSALGPELTNFVSTSTLSSMIKSTGVIMELWLYSSTTNSWSRVADDSIISRNPQVKFESGSIFWVDKNNVSVWRYNPRSGGYDALSLSPGQVSVLQFRDEAGELRELEFSSSTSTIKFDGIKAAKPLPL